MVINRRLLFAERMMYTDGKTPFNAVLPITLEGRLSLPQIQLALAGLQQLHPILNTCVSEDEQGFPIFITAPAKPVIPIRVVPRVSDTQWKEESIVEWNTAFDPVQGPLIRLIWIESETVSDILIVFHHSLCDGKSGLLLIQEFLQLMEQPEVQLPKEMPFQHLNELIPAEILNKKSNIFKYKFQAGAFRVLLNITPVKRVNGFRIDDYLINQRLSPEETARLIAFCKANGVTVNTFMSLAILNAYKSVRGKRSFNKITIPVDIRCYLPELQGGKLFASGLMMVLSNKQKEGTDFIAIAKALQEQANVKAKKLNAHHSLMMFEYAHPLLNRFVDVLKYSKPGNDCMFSNMGPLPVRAEYNGFTLLDIHTPSVIGPLGNPSTIVISTFKGQLNFSFTSSENYLAKAEAIQIKEAIFETLFQKIN